MSQTFERLAICNDPVFARELLVNRVDTAPVLQYSLSSDLERLLFQHNLLVQVVDLLTEGLSVRPRFYGLCTRDIVKFPTSTSSVFYVWDKNIALWVESKRSSFQSTYMKYLIESVYTSVILCIKEIPNAFHDVPSKNKKVITTTAELQYRLAKLRNSLTSLSKMREISQNYINSSVDEEFPQLINPGGYIAVAGKQVVNLRTGEVRARVKTDYFTQEILTVYNPNANSELWNNSISQMMLHNEEMINFLQEVLGYAISGSCKEGKMIMLIGSSKAGKSVIITLLDNLLQRFSTSLAKSIIVDSGRVIDSPDPFMDALKNKRVGIINELQQKDSINTTKFKILATNEKYVYRLLHSNETEQTNSRHVILLASNHKPIFPETDDSIWERLLIINFKAKFTDKPKNDDEFLVDRDLLSKLQVPEVKQAFLKWLVDGAIRYYNHGRLMIPQTCLDALEDYRVTSQNDVEIYFNYRLEITKDSSDKIQVMPLYRDYESWCIENGVKKISHLVFGEFITKKNIAKVKNGESYYTHLKFKDATVAFG